MVILHYDQYAHVLFTVYNIQISEVCIKSRSSPDCLYSFSYTFCKLEFYFTRTENNL